MKKILLLAFCSFLYLNGFSQITITTSHMPKSGDTIRYSVAAITDLPDLTKTGADFTWNYSEMGMQSQAIYEYVRSSKTPYILNFGFSAIGLKISDSLGTGQMALQNIYNFYRNSSSKWETAGIGFQYSTLPLPQSGKYSNSDEIYKFPLTYNDSYNGTFEAKVPIVLGIVPVGNFFIKGSRTTEVDGWGKITTPYANKVDCIRVKSVIEETDSVAISSMNINLAIPTKKVEYKWLSTTERIPILEITGTEVLGNFVPTYIRYRDTFRTKVGIFDIVADFKADTVNGTTNDTIKLIDLSEGTILDRTWTITPNSFSFVNGTDENSKDPEVKFNKAGKYTVKLVASNFIGSDSATKTDYLEIKQGASILPVLNDLSTKIHPNPFINKLEIRLGSKKESTFVKIYDANGRLVFEENYIQKEKINIPTQSLETGVYLITIETDGIHHHQKIQKIE